MKKILIFIIAIMTTTSCAMFSDEGQGQIVYHWEKDRTGVEKFVRDHSECLRYAEPMAFFPDVKSWFYTEERKNNIVVDWHSQTGVWATYIPYRGAQPLIINSLRSDERIKPKTYRLCMEEKGYQHRLHSIPEITNIFVYQPQRVLEFKPTIERDF